MTSSSSKVKKGLEMLVCRFDCKDTTFKLTLVIAEALDPTRAQSQIFPKVLLINDIRAFYNYSIQELGTLEMT